MSKPAYAMFRNYAAVARETGGHMDKREQELMTFRQVLDQTGEMLRDVAGVVARYYGELVASGVPKQAAAVLAAEVQASILALILIPKPPEARP